MGEILITHVQAEMGRSWVQNECLSSKMIRKQVHMDVTSEAKESSVCLFHSKCVLRKV